MVLASTNAPGQMARIEGDVTDDIAFDVSCANLQRQLTSCQERYDLRRTLFPTVPPYDFDVDGRKSFLQPISVPAEMFGDQIPPRLNTGRCHPSRESELEKWARHAPPTEKNPPQH